MEDDPTTIQKSPILHFPSDHRRATFEMKLKQELELPSKLFCQSFYEDIYAVLTLRDWTDEHMLRFIQTPSLLQEVALALHNDNIFSAFYEQRIVDLTLKITEKL